MSTKTALANFSVLAPSFVYEAVDPMTKVAFYVGRTGDLDRRAKQHQKKCMTKIRELMKLKNFKFADVQRRVPELRDGCAAVDAQEMEAFFIFQRKVVYDPETCPWGCNSRIGDHGTEMTPARFAELKKMFAGEGYKFPIDELKDLRDARAEFEIANDFVAMAEQVGDAESVEVFRECRVLAKRMLLDVERAHLGLRAFVERVLEDYQDKYVDAVDQATLQVGLNLIKEKMDEDDEFVDLKRVVTSMSLVCKEKEGVDVSSEAAANGLKMVLAMISSREESKLKWTHKIVKANMMAVRTWTRANAMAKPKAKAVTKEENRLGSFLRNWKADNITYGGKCTDLVSCRVIMRGVPWFEDFVGSIHKNATDWTELNKQLCDGFAWSAEPDFEGKRSILSGKDNKSIYVKLQNLVQGSGSSTDVATALKGLPAARATYYQGLYDANRPALLQKVKDRDAAIKKRKRENAIEPDQKNDEGEDDENDDENDDDDDDDDDEN